MADLSNVPPEVLQILTHDPPYSAGEKAILQSYILRPDANPVVLRAFQNMGVLPGDSARAFHADLRNKGAGDINWDTYVPGQPQMSSDLGIPGLNLPDNLDGLSGLSGLNPIGSGIEAEKANPRASAYDTVDFPQVLDRPDPGRQSRHQITADWAAPFGGLRSTDGNFGGLITSGGPPNPASGGDVYIPAAGTPTRDFMTGPGGGGSPSSGGGADPYARTAQPASSLTALFGESPATSRTPDGMPAGSNTMTQGAGTPGATDWKAERTKAEIDFDPLRIDPTSAFASVADSQLARVAANPEFMADVLYPGAPNLQANQTEWLANVKMLSELGLLSNIPNADIFTGKPEGNVMMLEQVEALKNSMAGKGSEVDPRAIYQKAFARILNSDASKFLAEDYGQGVAGDAENQIAVTNGMLGAVAPFVYSGSREAYIQRLNMAGMQYLSEVAMSGTSLSYPEWLKAHGADTWMS